MTMVASLTADEPTARRVAALLAETLDSADTACAAFAGDDGHWQVAVHGADGIDRERLRALVALAAGREAARRLAFHPLTEADWVAKSLDGLCPVRAGRFVVHGSHDRACVPANAVGIEIEAALAFGTGHHGTTRGCLLALDTLAKQQSPIPPRAGVPSAASRAGISRKTSPLPFQVRKMRVLDIGTGSGVLAIAAARRLDARVVASDIDCIAVEAARNNARLNRAPGIRFVHAAGASACALQGPGSYDLIFANILLGPLTRLARPIRKLAARNARVVLSGLLPSHANAAFSAYAAHGFVLERRIPLDGWMTLVLRRR